MKAFTIKVDYVNYDENTGKRKVIKKDIIDELWQLYEFQMMDMKDNFSPFYEHLNKWLITEIRNIINEEYRNERKNNRK